MFVLLFSSFIHLFFFAFSNILRHPRLSLTLSTASSTLYSLLYIFYILNAFQTLPTAFPFLSKIVCYVFIPLDNSLLLQCLSPTFFTSSVHLHYRPLSSHLFLTLLSLLLTALFRIFTSVQHFLLFCLSIRLGSKFSHLYLSLYPPEVFLAVRLSLPILGYVGTREL